ncbi:cytochrome P450, partial [Vararia minispora EC-137]
LLSAKLVITYLVSLTATTVAYRLSPFHPLARFPGPPFWAASSLFLAIAALGGQRYLIIDALHAKYGEFVRLGPDVLSVTSPHAPRVVYGSAFGLDKGEYYRRPGRGAGTGLFFKQPRLHHFRRKKIWKRAFTAAAAEEFLPSLERRTWQLIECILRRRDKRGRVDLLQCISHYSWDFMGEFVYGGASSLELMRDGDVHGLISEGKTGLKLFDSLGHVPWLMDILWHAPAGNAVHSLFDIATAMIRERCGLASVPFRDLVSYLLEGDPVSGEQIPADELGDDAAIATQSSSDTTSSTLATIFTFLLTHPSALTALRKELEQSIDAADGPLDPRVLAGLPYLDAVINEALRLVPPLFSPRVVPPDGVAIGDTFVPPGTITVISAYTQQTDPKYFYPDPKAFRPERWLPGSLGPGSVLRRDIFLPFSAGTFICVAKDWALLQARFVTARLVLTLDLALPPPEDFDKDRFYASYRNHRSTSFGLPFAVEARARHEVDV